MKKSDFKKFAPYFTAKEVTATGAKLKDVNIRLLIALFRLRKLLGRRIKLIKNGMTTGKHKSKEHPDGEAADIAFYIKDGEINVDPLHACCMMAGFKGIGIYHNTRVYSVHLDIGKRFRRWTAVKIKSGKKKGQWEYLPFINDPKLKKAA